MLRRISNAIFNPHSVWRSLVRHGILDKKRAPADWLHFRHQINRECALRLNPVGGAPKRLLEDVFPSITERMCKIKVIRPTAYNVSWEEICVISQIVEMTAPKKIFEFGTFDGRTTLHLAANAQANAVVYSLDIQSGEFNFVNDKAYFQKMAVGEQLVGVPLAAKVELLKGDSAKFDFSRYVGEIDCVFIDADHSYSAVMADSENAFKMLRPGGVILWHDYLLIDDVSKAIIEIRKTRNVVNIKGTSLVVWKRPS